MKIRTTVTALLGCLCGPVLAATVTAAPHDHARGPVAARVDPAVVDMMVALDHGPDGGMAIRMAEALRVAGSASHEDRGMIELMAGMEGAPAAAAGSVLDVPAQGWAAVVARASGGLRGGARCTLDAPGTVEVLGTDAEFGALLRYEPGGGEPSHQDEVVDGPFCKAGTLTFVDRLTVAGWKEHVDVDRAARREAAVRRLVGGR